LRYLFADIIGDDDAAPPVPPAGTPESAVSVVRDGIARLIDYQGPSYARLYVERLQRFIGRRGMDDGVFTDIARLMADRMSYDDPIRIAQMKLVEYAGILNPQAADDFRKFRLDELVGALPAKVAEPVLDVFGRVGWTHRSMSIRFSASTPSGLRRLRIEAGLKRWRLFSIRYAEERAWVERWLHMIGRSLTKQPRATSAIVQTATMIQGYGDGYRQGVADWHAIIDGLVKPTLDGVLPIQDLAGAIAQARTAIMPDPRQASLKREIATIRAQALNKNVA
jgi:hypothetical protein